MEFFLYINLYNLKFDDIMFKSMILCFILVMAILNLIKEGYRFFSAFSGEKKYESGIARTVLTFASIAYIITIIFFGL